MSSNNKNYITKNNIEKINKISAATIIVMVFLALEQQIFFL